MAFLCYLASSVTLHCMSTAVQPREMHAFACPVSERSIPGYHSWGITTPLSNQPLALQHGPLLWLLAQAHTERTLPLLQGPPRRCALSST